MHFLKYVLVAAVSVIPLITSATSFDEIKQNAKKNRESATLGTASTPPNQVAIAPAISWVPNLNLDNATGTPRIELSNATGEIANTSGVSNDIKEFVKNEIANAKLTTPTGGWEIVYSGSGTNYLSNIGTFTLWKAKYSYTGSNATVSSSNKTYFTERQGNYNESVKIGFSLTAGSGAGNCPKMETSSASVSVLMGNNIDTRSLYNKGALAVGGCGSTAQAVISDVKLVYLEVYR